ncbi:hypothetical protein EVAR_83597_1 [Eumeta japonica]|uniref:Uncharacterized protein n=1 Tax=Eumeta variegata TaxID=151549 RepID=A0A4C1UPI0_EUMVA|nr:hypothetical protein EVAR_83597_1 [Eumeta japonica]
MLKHDRMLGLCIILNGRVDVRGGASRPTPDRRAHVTPRRQGIVLTHEPEQLGRSPELRGARRRRRRPDAFTLPVVTLSR